MAPQPANLSILTEAQALSDESVCANCDAPGTHVVDDADAYCVACYAKVFSECPKCGRVQVENDDEAWAWKHYPGTRWDPPEDELIGCRDCVGTCERERGDDDGVEYADPREMEA